jgi:hypothetical protein
MGIGVEGGEEGIHDFMMWWVLVLVRGFGAVKLPAFTEVLATPRKNKYSMT